MTLIEIVIAIFVLSVGVIGIISLFPSGYRLSQAAIDRSVATLASQDAIARLMAQSRVSGYSLPGMNCNASYQWTGVAWAHPNTYETAEPLAAVRENDRIGMVYSVDSTSQFTARICGDVTLTPQNNIGLAHYWPSSLAGYYVVMTSGTLAGTLYKITSSSTSGQLTFSSNTADEWYVNFRTLGAKAGDPIRVGDQFAIIGSKLPGGTYTPLTCYPTAFLTSGGSFRTMKVATEGGNYGVDPWLYSYGAIVSAPTPESPRTCRVDVFVYRGLDYTNGTVKIGQLKPAGWIVTCVPNFANMVNPDN